MLYYVEVIIQSRKLRTFVNNVIWKRLFLTTPLLTNGNPVISLTRLFGNGYSSTPKLYISIL